MQSYGAFNKKIGGRTPNSFTNKKVDWQLNDASKSLGKRPQAALFLNKKKNIFSNYTKSPTPMNKTAFDSSPYNTERFKNAAER